MKEPVEMKNDGHDADRFRDLLKKVVSVPKDEIRKREEQLKKETKKKG